MSAAGSGRQFEGRVAVVTGGSGGIGAALCHALADGGAAVAVGFGSNGQGAEAVAAEIGARGGTALPVGADMEDPEAPDRLIEEVEAALGAIDVLVVNHGIARQSDYENLDARQFARTLAINLTAPFMLARATLPAMRERGFGRILFISSVAAFRGGVIGADYAASKAGLHGLAHFLASRTAQDGVTVNVLAPGFIRTAMLPGNPEQLAGSVPVARVGEPQEVAQLAIGLLANGYLTNQVISLDGGMHPR